jgi:uncharacterized repeat protein (TIGR01451 family)
LAAALVSASLFVVAAPAAHAATGAEGNKVCAKAPAGSFFTLGDTTTCAFAFSNVGDVEGTVTTMTEQVPFPGGPMTQIKCTIVGTSTQVGQGDVMPADPTATPTNPQCTGTLQVTIPNDPALCNTILADHVDFEMNTVEGPAGANDSALTPVVCAPKITVKKTATSLSKPTDPVNYTVQVCNVGDIAANKVSVMDTLEGDISAAFPATLAPGVCFEDAYSRVVLASDPNPLLNTVTATYNASTLDGTMASTATDTASTDLFFPSVDVTKSCSPNPIEASMNELCHIVITNTSTGTTPPPLIVDSISDTLTGDHTGAAGCGSLAVSASCSFDTNRTVLDTDPTPLSNTVTVHYHPEGFTNDITHQATASVDIVTPAIKLTESVNELSKPTDTVTYLYTVCNTGTESVTRQSVVSSVNGDITSSFPATLGVGDCVDVSVNHIVTASDPAPLVDTTTAKYQGIAVTASSTSSASTDLFFPKVDVTKSCSPSPIEVGQDEHCNIVITNTSTGTTPPPLIVDSISDTLTGDHTGAAGCGSLAVSASCSFDTTRTVLDTDPTPLSNTVTVHYHPEGFTNDITHQATASVDIVAPAISFTESVNGLSKPTDTITYVYTVCNTGTESVTRQSVMSSVNGDITSSFPATLAVGACSAPISVNHIVTTSDPNPLVDTTTAKYQGISAVASAPASGTTDLFFPKVDVTKSCSPNPIEVGQDEHCHIVITNTSTGTTPPSLIVDSISDTLTGDHTGAAGCGSLAVGASCSIDTTRTVLDTDPTPLSNTVTVHYHPEGFTNDITHQASASVDIVAPAITLTETVNGLSKPTDTITYVYTVCNTGTESVTRQSVMSSVNGDITSSFPATLAVGACSAPISVNHIVTTSDLNPLVDSTTAIYQGIAATASAPASGSTDLFFPKVDVTKSCSPNPIEVGQDEACHIVITNTSTGTTPPPLIVDSISDTLTGDHTGAAGCGSLAVGASCSFDTTRTVLNTDPSPLSNTVTVHYHPEGFTNDITNKASASVTIASITFTVLGPVCVQDHPFIRWVITPHNVTDSNTATITITDIHGNVVKKLTDQPLTGETLWPGATINPDDWPGWKLVNGVWIVDPTDAVLREGVTVTAEVNPHASGFVAYPPATSACANPPRITFGFVGPVCVQDHPFIRWAIVPHNVTDATTATITITDIHGNVVKKLTDQPLSGETLWPGATINPDDWPGWKLVNGVWVQDPTDAVLRAGVTVAAEVNPSASKFIPYPPATSACANPPATPPKPPMLPFTGARTGPALIGLLILLAGAALVARTRRRRRADT